MGNFLNMNFPETAEIYRQILSVYLLTLQPVLRISCPNLEAVLQIIYCLPEDGLGLKEVSTLWRRFKGGVYTCGRSTLRARWFLSMFHLPTPTYMHQSWKYVKRNHSMLVPWVTLRHAWEALVWAVLLQANCCQCWHTPSGLFWLRYAYVIPTTIYENLWHVIAWQQTQFRKRQIWIKIWIGPTSPLLA